MGERVREERVRERDRKRYIEYKALSEWVARPTRISQHYLRYAHYLRICVLKINAHANVFTNKFFS